MSCSLSVKLLKRAIRQPRPSGPHQKKRSYGCVSLDLLHRCVLEPPFDSIQDAQYSFCLDNLLRDLHPTRLCLPSIASLLAIRSLRHSHPPFPCGSALGNLYRLIKSLAGTSFLASSCRRSVIWVCVCTRLVQSMAWWSERIWVGGRKIN